ncbi:sulfurtransferase complex subunit TusD [Acinetobacter radioresistens]|jgi:tRNA 2-thiouridine synthesizing protein D|uniref:Sulfurtransferase complex subunit TusD n=2 Tax=Acinetobacter radioresistens TaxID=40216 RepID=A0A2T1IWY9_ACIRA|nr:MULTISPECIES: sulfurtransferase complex subunit TusD [Acinetobacter]AWV86161.1 sulfurtransferase complex subunit TusD [Acinetobacter radioresistens]EET83123.1 sulfur relay protein TusD/DsrE [Acinetobacter radioresistens SK82]EEY87462.1 sulfur relay protein TusD/DsrE [Acinetobacter radioresistens SH164]EJO37288.1 sulfur relay protein TusD/DsrE [Acinetobacter radioresistens WC-A-157]ENV87782.1 sulfur relay protein TusD/DsrE [Acinetobacter radioresistens NIPH 2130]
MSTLLLITSAPTSIYAWHALGLAQALKTKDENFRVFFYQDGVMVANSLQWLPDDQRSLTHEWQKLNIRLPVCVSAALARGITDEQNAQRHQISQYNLAQGFELVGLGELADAVQSAQRLIQF